eukprot:PhM_4_TR16821/c4_g7_i3/m.47791
MVQRYSYCCATSHSDQPRGVQRCNAAHDTAVPEGGQLRAHKVPTGLVQNNVAPTVAEVDAVDAQLGDCVPREGLAATGNVSRGFGAPNGFHQDELLSLGLRQTTAQQLRHGVAVDEVAAALALGLQDVRRGVGDAALNGLAHVSVCVQLREVVLQGHAGEQEVAFRLVAARELHPDILVAQHLLDLLRRAEVVDHRRALDGRRALDHLAADPARLVVEVRRGVRAPEVAHSRNVTVCEYEVAGGIVDARGGADLLERHAVHVDLVVQPERVLQDPLVGDVAFVRLHHEDNARRRVTVGAAVLLQTPHFDGSCHRRGHVRLRRRNGHVLVDVPLAVRVRVPLRLGEQVPVHAIDARRQGREGAADCVDLDLQ